MEEKDDHSDSLLVPSVTPVQKYFSSVALGEVEDSGIAFRGTGSMPCISLFMKTFSRQ